MQRGRCSFKHSTQGNGVTLPLGNYRPELDWGCSRKPPRFPLKKSFKADIDIDVDIDIDMDIDSNMAVSINWGPLRRRLGLL